MSGELEAAWMGEKGRLDVTLDRLDVDALRLSCSSGWKGRRRRDIPGMEHGP